MNYLEIIKHAKKDGATELDLSGTEIKDLSLIKGMPLEWLYLSGTQVSDLSPLKGMPLKWLFLSYTKVSDISPMVGMPIEWLCLVGTPAAEQPIPDWLTCRIYK